MDNGEVHYTFSEERFESIMKTDHCEIRFNSRFSLVIFTFYFGFMKYLLKAAYIGTNDIRDNLIIQPNESLIKELEYEMMMNVSFCYLFN